MTIQPLVRAFVSIGKATISASARALAHLKRFFMCTFLFICRIERPWLGVLLRSPETPLNGGSLPPDLPRVARHPRGPAHRARHNYKDASHVSSGFREPLRKN